jgi:hypothetical protein
VSISITSGEKEHSGGVDSELLIRIRDALISHLHLLNPVDISDISDMILKMGWHACLGLGPKLELVANLELTMTMTMTTKDYLCHCSPGHNPHAGTSGANRTLELPRFLQKLHERHELPLLAPSMMDG